MNLPKAYEPGQYESDIYALWEQGGAFEPQGKGTSYTIVMPPPNANANLHMGHALTVAVEDIPARFQRMRGRRTLLLPGADHAGFETQAVYEKHLAKEGKSRFDFSREDLYRNIYDFVALNRRNFESQIRRLGVSCDWSRFTFTLDEKIISRAYATFKQLWDDGLIYRGERLVNYCTFHGTAFADIEVVYKEAATKLWHIRYPLVDDSGEVVVATTRPETMLGDTGVAVHPDDARYAKLIGKTVRLPLIGREVPIVADDFVETGFGTGAVKLTPAHDQNDFDAAERHHLPKLTIINHEGKLTGDIPEKYRGLSVQEARKAVVDDLRDGGWLTSEEELTHNVGHCYKCGTVIEPLLREQWFVDMQPLAQKAIAALEAKKIRFYPDAKREQLISYLQNLRDWNISRQIAWGIPIPAFQNIDDSSDWIYDESVHEEIIERDGKTYHRDPDVFDTWFSSSSWPYATLGLDSDDFKQHYPLSLMETGGEILYPWVSRMIMLGLYVTGEIPFKEVYIHGYVMAEDGAKMSKSLGNVVDPMPVIDRYGSDALRMGIIAGRSPAVNRGYDPRRVEEARNFCNKLWNIARFAEAKLGEAYQLPAKPQPASAADHWILSKLQQAAEVLAQYLDEYRFSEAYEHLYHFVWDDVADWYIEASKTEQGGAVLGTVLDGILRLAHPFAPFVTETIWQTLSWTGDSLLAIQTWPGRYRHDMAAAKDFAEIQCIITEVRALAASLDLTKPTLYFTDAPLLQTNTKLITSLGGLGGVQAVSDGNGLYLTHTSLRCWLDVDASVTRTHLENLATQQTAGRARVQQLEARLGNKGYTQHAPKHLVEETSQQLAEAQAALDRLAGEQKRFEELEK